MNVVFLILLFILGLNFGSFFNVVGLRLPENQPFTYGRSYCPLCKNTLSWYELIPVFSFLLQSGKCRHCYGRIAYIYPMCELMTGLLFVFSYIKIGIKLELIIAILLISMLMIIVVSDVHFMLIPNKILLFFLPLFIIMRSIEQIDPWWSAMIGAMIGFSLVAIIILFSGGGMGAGDMKLFGVLGIVLGLQKVLLAFILACMIGAIVGMLFLLCKIVDRKQPIPFAPYIVIATYISYFFGESITKWYFNFFRGVEFFYYLISIH